MAEVTPRDRKNEESTYEAWEGYTAIAEHVRNARGVADTNRHTRGVVDTLDKLLDTLDKKIAPLEKKLVASRERMRRA